MDGNYSGYKSLIGSFTSGLISIEHFETEYLRMFKADEQALSEEAYVILDKLFSDVDCFTEDDALIAEDPTFNIGREELLNEAKLALIKLENLSPLS